MFSIMQDVQEQHGDSTQSSAVTATTAAADDSNVFANNEKWVPILAVQLYGLLLSMLLSTILEILAVVYSYR
jgi:hypothetical protein